MQTRPPDLDTLLPFLLVIAGAVAVSVWRYRTARAIAEEWLLRHRYRVRSLRMTWFHLPRFAPKLFRNEKRAFEFRAEVDDLRLGGTGVLFMRVWTDWIGISEREPEINWERMPVAVDDGSRAMEDKWHARQRALLERVADGEHTFRPEGRTPEAGIAFDETVEHLLALSRRGLLTCRTPVLDVRGQTQYVVVTDVALTDAGRRFLERDETR